MPRNAPSPRRFASVLRRVPRYLGGLAVMAAGLAVMLEAGVGVGPWAVFHEGIEVRTVLTFGQALMLVGFVVLAASWGFTGERPGPGTFVNMVLVGPFVDAFRAFAPIPEPSGFALGLTQAALGTVLVGLGSGMYITARFGAGPRDGFVLGLARLFGTSVRRTRTGLEIAVLAIGWLLGGTVGVGTLLFALLIGPSMQTAIRWLQAPRPKTPPKAAPASGALTGKARSEPVAGD